jgi:DNA-binding PadR family transcriptional regulator
MLFLISENPGIRSDYDMIRLYDRTIFPSNLTENLDPMLDEGLIKPSKYDKNEHVSEYEITEKGLLYLKENFDETEVFEFIKTGHNPNLLMDVTKAYIDRKKGI